MRVNIDYRLLSVCFLILSSCAITSTRELAHQQEQFHLSQDQAQGDRVEISDESVLSETSSPMSANDISSEGVSEIIDEERIINEQILDTQPIVSKKSIPLPTNKYVNKWINYFTGRGRPGMQKYLERSGKYVNSMKKVLIKKGLPEDLVYLPVIESGFSTRALSNKGAKGYWQFMPSTARGYGLKVNSLVDERNDYVRSTEAASVYLKKLYTVFGDWYLALAAYNAGENRIKSQLMKAETRNYWELIDRKGLYRETRDYVPKYIAATLIAKNPHEYGFTNVQYQDEQSYQKMFVKKPIDLRKLATAMRVPFTQLKKLNPRYKTSRVPIYRGHSVLVRVPHGMLANAQASLMRSRTTVPRSLYKPMKPIVYKVRRGDNLTRIARKFGVTVSQLKRRNKLGRRSVLYVGRKLKISSKQKTRVANSRKVESTQQAKVKYRSLKKVHKVRRGENLTLIAKRYGLSLSEVAKMNGFSIRKRLKVGDRIKLTGSSGSISKVRRKESTSSSIHRVKSGENLNLLAKKYGTTVRKIKKQNGLISSRLMTGQKLKIASGSIKYHVVRRGESLIAIAKKYKVSLGKLLSINNFKNKSKINIGSKVKIPLVARN